MALQLRRQGITRVRPLLGGLDGWIELGFPTESRVLEGLQDESPTPETPPPVEVTENSEESPPPE